MENIKAIRIIKSIGVCEAENILKDNIDQAVFNQRDCIIIKDQGFILLDFGKEINGGILITTQNISNPDTKLKIVFGESVTEAMSRLGENYSGNHHSLRDMTIPALFMSTQRFGYTGFRFVKLEAIGGDITIRAAKAVSDIKDIDYVGDFKCSDPILNEIWQTSAYTVHLNMNKYLWDGIKRDRLVWIGDMHPEVSTIRAVFGNDECVKDSLEMIKNETPPDGWMNNVTTYSMWWIIIQHDLYMHWGDFKYLKNQEDYIIGIIDNLTLWIDNDYKTELPLGRFVDWSSSNQECEFDGIKAIACMALRCAKKIFDALNNKCAADKCTIYLDRLLKEPESDTELNNRIASLVVLSGKSSENAKIKLLSTTENEMSCFLGYYILLAMAKLCEYEKAIDLIKKYWGAMLKLGATTFWEEFKLEWAENAARIDEIPQNGEVDIHGTYGEHCYNKYRMSLCHGWASSPAAFLSEQIGGIRILEPGCKKVLIKPNTVGLEWLDISYPTPYGPIKVHYKKINGEEDLHIDNPDDIEVLTEI